MKRVYCGNNLNVLNNNKFVAGNNYQCLKKGINVGKYQKCDKNYAKEFTPINNNFKIFCGKEKNAAKIPQNSIVGTPTLCLQKGVGVGKKIRSSQIKCKNKNFIILSIILTIILLFILFGLIIIKIKPKFLLKENDKFDKTKLSFFILILILFMLIINFLVIFTLSF